MGTFNDTMSDLGTGTANLLTPVIPALILLVVGLGIGVAIASLIKRATVIKV